MVLIGGYKDMDAAHRAMKEIKKLPPPSSEKLMAVLAQAGPPKRVGDEQKSLLEALMYSVKTKWHRSYVSGSWLIYNGKRYCKVNQIFQHPNMTSLRMPWHDTSPMTLI